MALFFAQSQKPSGPDTRRAFPNRSDCANNTGNWSSVPYGDEWWTPGGQIVWFFTAHCNSPIFPAAQRKPETVSKSVLLVDGRCYGTMGCQGPDGADVRDDV